MEWYEAEVQKMEQALLLEPPPANAIIFYGSSSIRLWTSLADDFQNDKVVNLGFGGSTLAACVWFFERLVAPCRPHSLLFYAGDNDLGDGQSPEEVVGSFHALLEKVNYHFGQIPFGFISIKPSPARWNILDRIRQTNRMIQRELLQRESSYYIDMFHPMLGRTGFPRPELFETDGLHLSLAGYQLWVKVLSRYRQQLF